MADGGQLSVEIQDIQEMPEIVKNAKFDFKILHDRFRLCLRSDGELDVDEYLLAFDELCKFCNLLGTIFGFVVTEIRSKMHIIEEHRKSEKGEQFATVERMIAYEKEENLLQKDHYVSGCRTFLRLHRALDFLAMFLHRVSEIEDKDKCGSVGSEAYTQTLGKFHPWIIRKTASSAMYWLPSKENLIKKVSCDSDTEKKRVLDLLPKVVEVSREVYNHTQSLYEEHDLLTLP